MTDRVIRDLETQGIVQRVGTAGLVLLDPDRLRIVADVESDERECS